MNKEEQDRRIEDFEWWITCIPDKIEALKNETPTNVSEKLDYSLDSLLLLEEFIIKSYSADFLKSENGKLVLDRLASYIGSTMKKLIPSLKWHVELKNEDDIYFALPVLIDSVLPPLCPHKLPITACLKGKGNVIMKKVANRI